MQSTQLKGKGLLAWIPFDGGWLFKLRRSGNEMDTALFAPPKRFYKHAWRNIARRIIKHTLRPAMKNKNKIIPYGSLATTVADPTDQQTCI